MNSYILNFLSITTEATFTNYPHLVFRIFTMKLYFFQNNIDLNIRLSIAVYFNVTKSKVKKITCDAFKTHSPMTVAFYVNVT